MIKSKRCRITLLVEGDFEEIIGMYGEKDSNKYIRPLRDRDPSTYEDFLNGKIAQFSEGKGFFWTVRNLEGRFLGTANYNFFEPLQINHCGVHLARQAWGQGYATEILEAIKTFANTKHESSLNALVEKGNAASVRMLEKTGFYKVKNLELSGDQLYLYKCDIE